MSGHTPGPWSVGEDGDMVWGPKWKGEKVLVANVPFTKDPRVEADAHLIAAAPELLDALREFVSGAATRGQTASATYIKAQSAIVKATGGAE